MQRGEGEVTVNGQRLLHYFPQTENQQQVMFPLVATAMLGAVDVMAQVKGGGKTGEQWQAAGHSVLYCPTPPPPQGRLEPSVWLLARLC